MNPSPLRNKKGWDCSVKSNFELSFSGENKLLIDEIQYQIDSLKSLSSNVGSKLHAVGSLIDIFEKSIGGSLRKQLHSQIIDLLQIISILFTTHIENTLLTMNLLVLVLLICSDMDGTIDPTIIIPDQLMTNILHYDRANNLNECYCTCSVPTNTNTYNTTKLSEKEGNINNDSQSNLTRTSTMDTFNSDSGFRRKRKFTGLLSKSSSIQNTTTTTIGTSTTTGIGNPSYPTLASSSIDMEEIRKTHVSSPIISMSHKYSSSTGTGSTPLSALQQHTIYNENRQSILFKTFWCNKCCNNITTTAVAVSTIPVVATGSDHALQRVKLLQLIILNRFLNAKVQTLATIQTDFFQSTDYIDPNQQKQQSEELHGIDSTAGSSSSIRTSMECIQSPNDPTSRTSKSFYQRQTESLGQLQVSLQEHYSITISIHQQQTADGQEAVVTTVLENICTQLHTDVNTLLKHNTTTPTTADKEIGIVLPSEGKALWGRLWLQLGILDSACFRCPYNQKYLSKLSFEDSATDNHPNRETVVELLVRLLQGLTPYLGSIMTNRSPTGRDQMANQALTGREHTATTISGPYTSPIKASTSTTAPPTPTTHTTPMKAKPSMNADWKKFHNLFSEIPIVLSHSVSEEYASSSIQSPIDTHINSNTTTEASINIPELFTLALKTLVSLTTDCNEVSCILLNATNNKKKKEFLTWIITLLSWCSVWRYELTTIYTTNTNTASNSSSNRQQQKSGALSPNETVPERFIFDTIMYLQLLLNTLCSSSSTSSITGSNTTTSTSTIAAQSIADMPVLDCLQHYTVLLHSLPLSSHTTATGTTTTTSTITTHPRTAHLREKCPLILHLHSSSNNTSNSSINNKTIRKNASKQIQNLTVSDLLVEMLYIETIDFVVDLEETDDMIQNNSIDITKDKSLEITEKSPIPKCKVSGIYEKSPIGKSKVSGIHEKSPAVTTPLQKRIGNTKVGGTMMIPVAELILAAHISLLLHTLERVRTPPSIRRTLLDEGTTSTATITTTIPTINIANTYIFTTTFTTVTTATPATAATVSKSIRFKLPHGDWWLCERVLKAFLSLQGQTGIMLLDNISTVLRTLADIKEQKQQQQEEEEHENNEQIIKNSLTIEDNHHTTTTSQYKQASSVIVRHSSIPSNTSTTTAGFDELVGAGSKIDFSGEGEHPTATTGTTFHRASTTSSITSRDRGKATAPSGKWEWNGHDYVWITTKPAAELLQEKGLGQVELKQERYQEEDCLLEKREVAMKKIDSRLDLEQSVVSQDTVPIDLFQEASSLPSASIGANTTARVPVVLSTPPCSQSPVTSPKPCIRTPVTSPKPSSQTAVSSPKPSSPRWAKPVMPSPSIHSVAATAYTDDAAISAPVITAATIAPLVPSIKTTKILSTEPNTTAATTDTYATSTSLSYSCTQSKKQRTSPSKQAKTADLFPVCSSRAPLRTAPMRALSVLSYTTEPPPPTAGPSHADTIVLHSSHGTSNTATTGSISRRDSAQLTATTSTTTKTKTNTSAVATAISLQTNTTKSTKQCILNKTTTNSSSSDIVSSNISTEQKSGWRSKRKFASSV